MYASQHINTDPYPYRIRVKQELLDPSERESFVQMREGERISSPEWVTFWDQKYEECVLDPRPEYDNRPNPILVAFRRETETCRGRHPITECAKLALYFEEDGDFLDQPQSVKDHARKVLTRLAALT